MCYDVAYLTKRNLDYAKKRGSDPETIKDLESKWKKVREKIPVHYHVSGFAHPELICYTSNLPYDPQPLYWGLIPFWVKDVKAAVGISNKTLNARGETIFEKPAFRDSAKKRRCLVMIDHFYEHHHFNGKTYPYLIKMKNDEPMILAGLWSEWENKESGEVRKSVSIVTSAGNELLAKIHNNPKLEGPRMPLILPQELQDEWLAPMEDELGMKEFQELIRPYDAREMEAWSVNRLRGKNAVGNTPECLEQMCYPELGNMN